MLGQRLRRWPNMKPTYYDELSGVIRDIGPAGWFGLSTVSDLKALSTG